MGKEQCPNVKLPYGKTSHAKQKNKKAKTRVSTSVIFLHYRISYLYSTGKGRISRNPRSDRWNTLRSMPQVRMRRNMLTEATVTA